MNGPTYTSLNRLQAQIVSNITASMRFESAVNLNLEEIQTNLIPFPRLHFPLMAYAPIVPPYKATYANTSVQQITSDCFDPTNHVYTYKIYKMLQKYCHYMLQMLLKIKLRREYQIIILHGN